MRYPEYPVLQADLHAIAQNARVICGLYEKQGISVAGVIKVSDGSPEIAGAYLDGGCRQLASSRICHLAMLRKAFPKVPMMLLRIPQPCEVRDVVEYADHSLNSEASVLQVLNDAAGRLGKTHKVILMLDVGDRREGVTTVEDLAALASEVKRTMPHLEVAGVGTNSPAATIRNIRLLEPYGPDAWLVVVPYYNKPTQQGIYEYFSAIAASTSIPIVAYNVPGRTGTNMTAETTIRVAGIPGVIAVKEASGNLEQIRKVVEGRPEGFKVFSGNDDQTLPIMEFGGDGIISVASNIAPKQMVGLVEALQAGDLEEAGKRDAELAPLYDACFVESNPIPAKAGLSILGLCTPEMRLPLTEAVSSTFDAMNHVIVDLGL